MRRVLKHRLSHLFRDARHQVITGYPKDIITPLHIAPQEGHLYLWALHTSSPTPPPNLELFAMYTGEPLSDLPCTYLDSVHMAPLVYHIFWQHMPTSLLLELMPPLWAA